MADVTMAFKTVALMSIIYKSQLTEWPTGEDHQVVSHFLEKYQPLHMVTLIEMQ